MARRPQDLKHRSREVTEGPQRAPARAYLRSMGLRDEDIARPFVGIANTWNDVMPCQINLDAIGRKVREGIRSAGGTPREFNTIAVSDGIAMGHEGMRASLVSREIIADSIELMIHAHGYDALVTVAGCDKTIPGSLMALARLNVPGVFTYGGTMLPGRYEGRDVTIQDVFEAVGAYAAGRIDAAALDALERAACPGAGTCAGLYTANTMASCAEALGMALSPGTPPSRPSTRPALTTPCASGRPPSGSSSWGSGRGTSSCERPSKTRSPSTPRWAGPRTRCCIFWRSPTRPA